MRPIAPPPTCPRSRNNRKKFLSTDPVPHHQQSSPVKSWVPFGQFGDDDYFGGQLVGDDIAIATSYSCEYNGEENGVETQLTSTLNNLEEASETNYSSRSIGDIENLAPVPLPSTPSENHSSYDEASIQEGSIESASMTHMSRNRPLSSLQSLSNQKIVQRTGLRKRSNKVPNKNEKAGQSRGVSMEPRSRGRVRTPDSASVRSSRGLSLLASKKQKKNRHVRAARSITRKIGNRTDSVELAERAGNDERRVTATENHKPEASAITSAPDGISGSGVSWSMREVQPSTVIVERQLTGNSNLVDEATSSSLKLPSIYRTRNLLATSVYHNHATGIWITTINMSQKETVNKSNAVKYLKAFSFQTEHEARESAYANAPARMLPFDEHPFCFICSAQFSVFKRAGHCRNCGVCICSTCSTSWKRVCVPETYNIKGETSIRICKSCDSLSKLFRTALLEANYESALQIYNTGNVNLRCPFMTNKGSEMMLPIHCAAEGGSLDLLEWLVEVHYCPLKRIRTGNRQKIEHSDEMITTSKGRTVLDIAMASQNVDIIRYLVNDKGIDIHGIKDLNVALAALEAVLKSPYLSSSCDENDNFIDPVERVKSSVVRHQSDLGRINHGLPNFTINSMDDSSDSEEESPRNEDVSVDSEDEQSVATTVHDACIICYANSIDCVITPCGHQICCLQCSKNMKSCPVCNVDCKFIRIFRP